MRYQGNPRLQQVESNRAAATGLAFALIALMCAGVYLYMRLGKAVSNLGVEPQAEIRQDVRALRDVDPQLVKWREVGRIETGFEEPRGIAIGPDGHLHVVGDEGARTFGAGSEQIGEAALGASPYCLAVDDSGTAYVGFRDHVEVYGAGWEPKARWGSLGEHAYLTSVAVPGDGVWVADAGNRVILRCDPEGQLLGRIGERDETRGIPGLVAPSPHLDVAVAPDGLLLVNNPGRRVVETYTPAGELESSWGKASSAIDGFCGCCNPTDIAVLPDGKVVTSEKGLPRVKVYNVDGTLESVVAAPADLSANAKGLDLAVDASGRIYALDAPARVVRVFARAKSEGGPSGVGLGHLQETTQ